MSDEPWQIALWGELNGEPRSTSWGRRGAFGKRGALPPPHIPV